jgi:hypothetical protein
MVAALWCRHKLKELQILDVGLDHENPASWSVLCERLLLSDVAVLATAGLKVHIDLPKLHPGFEISFLYLPKAAAPYYLSRYIVGCVRVVQY